MSNAEDKRNRILESAIDLAEQGGFEAVRLRDLAEHADVALGTLYKRFRSKEEILLAALDLEAQKMEKRFAARPVEGDTVFDRTANLFDALTRTLLRRPNLARAVLRALTSGDDHITQSVAGFHDRITSMIIGAMRGQMLGPGDEPRVTEQMVAFILQQVWFAALVGWMGGLFPKTMVTDQVRIALELLLRGVDLEKDHL